MLTSLVFSVKTAKLRMYACLSHVLYAYVLISFLLMATEGAVYVVLLGGSNVVVVVGDIGASCFLVVGTRARS